MTKLTQQEIEKLKLSFEKMIRSDLDSSYLKKDESGDYDNPIIQNSWMFNLTIYQMAKGGVDEASMAPKKRSGKKQSD